MDIVCGGGELYIVLYLPLYCLTNHAMLPGQMSVTFCIVIVHAYMASEIYITIILCKACKCKKTVKVAVYMLCRHCLSDIVEWMNQWGISMPQVTCE